VSAQVAARIKALRNEVAQTSCRLAEELENRTEWLQTRLSRLESNEQSKKTRLVALQNKVASLRRELGLQIAQNWQQTEEEVVSLRKQLVDNQQEVDGISQRLARQRMDFELAAAQDCEIAPGMILNVASTDKGYQRVDGWIRLVPDGRTLWVREQGIRQPIFFYTRQGGLPFELVFTRVTDTGAVGYILMPD